MRFGTKHVAIEMNVEGGVTSENQKKWIKTLNEAGIQTVVWGCDAAIEFIKSITWGFMTEVERLTAY